jgi:hypothetical protein
VLLDRVEQPAQGVTRHGFIVTLRQRVQILLNCGLGRRVGQRVVAGRMIVARREDNRGDYCSGGGSID